MPQTPEDRIRAQYRAEKRYVTPNGGLPRLWMRLARQWKRPVKEIKAICGYVGSHKRLAIDLAEMRKEL